MNFIVTSFYTVNTGYEKEVVHLIESLIRFKVEYDISGIQSLGSWDLNTKYKATHLKNMLEKYPGVAVVWLDADAVLHSYPLLFETIKEDLAVHYLQYQSRPPELLTGTMVLQNNDRVRQLLNVWIKGCELDARWEQKILQEIVNKKVIPTLTLSKLPPQYCKIFDHPNEVLNPVIEHFQYSRKVRKNGGKLT
jgi:hypothetical protein